MSDYEGKTVLDFPNGKRTISPRANGPIGNPAIPKMGNEGKSMAPVFPDTKLSIKNPKNDGYIGNGPAGSKKGK